MPPTIELFPTHRVKNAGPEWAGGRFTMPFEIEGARPLAALWVELPSGDVMGVDIHPSPAVEGWFARTLWKVMEKPVTGRARRPSRIRVADPALAAELRAAYEGIEVVVAATPEVDEAFEALTIAMGASPRRGYLDDGALSPEIVGVLFRAAERLYRFAPWTFRPEDVIRVDIPRLGIDGACLAVIGQGGEEHGFLLFPSMEGYDAFCEEAEILAEGGEPEGTGSALLSLTFEKKSDVSAATLGAIKEHRWPVAGPKAYPRAESRDAYALVLPLTERDVRTLIACANALVPFCARHRDVLSGERADSISESFTGDDDLTVRLTYPLEDAELFDTDEPPQTFRKAPAPGRNDPCHCGSGKKYKKCHLGRDQEEAGPDRFHAMDHDLLSEMSRFGAKQFGTKWVPQDLRAVAPGDALHLVLQWAAYELPVEGRTLIDRFVERYELGPQERDWLAAQRRAWLSIWEVVSVVAGKEITMRDLLTGQTRTVLERQASLTLVARDAVLGRVVDHQGLSLLCGMYARSLPPFDAALVVRDVRGKLRKKTGDLPVDRLRGKSAGHFMITRWADAVEDLDERHSKPPVLTNTDGDSLVFITDHFDLDRGKRKAVEDLLAALEGAGDPYADGDETHIALFKPEELRDGEDATVIGHLFVGDDTLRLETNSQRRAVALRRKVERACGELIRHRSRVREDPRPVLENRDRPAEPPRERAPEELRLVREYKERYYKKWLNQPVPALGGKTPREASRSHDGRAALDLLLRNIENGEASLPEAARFDVSQIRAALGVD